MNCGIYCLQEYLKLYDIQCSFHYDKSEISMLELVQLLDNLSIEANGYYSKRVYKNAPYILYLPKHKHFMLVKKIGWFVLLSDQNIKDLYVPYFIYKFIYQGYLLKIVLDND